MKYKDMEKIRMFEAFAGYRSQTMAMKRLPIDFEVVGISEIDKYAITAGNAVHGETPNYGDITKINWGEVSDFDLFTMSSPCTDYSSAGQQKGDQWQCVQCEKTFNPIDIDFSDICPICGTVLEKTRSSLLYECAKAIRVKRPKYILLENVKALVGSKFIKGFNQWQNYLTKLGYSNFTQVLNAKDYGVPQNRERVFMVSILGEDVWYNFPKPIKLTKCLGDVLESEVDEKYFLKQRSKWILTDAGRKCVDKGWAKIDGHISQCLTFRGYPSWNYQYVTQNGRVREIT